MRKRTKISHTLIFFMVVIIMAIMGLSYWFYNKTSKIEDKTKVKADDFLSIDSLKNAAVHDTVQYLNSKLKKCEVIDISKDSTINHLMSEKQSLRKDYDSVVHKLDYYRQRVIEMRSTPDSVRN